MLLFRKAFHEGLKSGAIKLTFRRWVRTKVKVGGRYRCHPIGVLEVDAVSTVPAARISEGDAKQAGYATRGALVSALEEFGGPLAPDEPIFRVELHYGGDGDRVQEALETDLTDNDVAALREKLQAMDARSPRGAWTKQTLRLIDKHPRTAASRLAARIELETAPFKAEVVKLKKLGLTQSFEVGYELSPRGRAFVEAVKWNW